MTVHDAGMGVHAGLEYAAKAICINADPIGGIAAMPYSIAALSP